MSGLHVRVRVADEHYALPVADVLEVAELGEVDAGPRRRRGGAGRAQPARPGAARGRPRDACFGLPPADAGAHRHRRARRPQGRPGGGRGRRASSSCPRRRGGRLARTLAGAALDGRRAGRRDRRRARCSTTWRGERAVSEPDAEILEVFREEATERLDRMVETLLALEAGTRAADAIDSLFRDAHSIKGSAGMVGIEEVAHDRPRGRGRARGAPRDRATFAPELIEPMLRATDALRRAVPARRRAAAQSSPAAAPAAQPPATAPAGRAAAPMRDVGARRSIDLLDAVGETVLHSRRLEHAARRRADGRDREQLEDELAHGERAARGAAALGDPDAHAAAQLDHRAASRVPCATSPPRRASRSSSRSAAPRRSSTA